MNYNELPKEERICVNCAHYRRQINPLSLLNLLIDDGELYHRCALNGTSENLDLITGKKTIAVSTVACKAQKIYPGTCNEINHRWEPSEQWKKEKENLFKILKT